MFLEQSYPLSADAISIFWIITRSASTCLIMSFAVPTVQFIQSPSMESASVYQITTKLEYSRPWCVLPPVPLIPELPLLEPVLVSLDSKSFPTTRLSVELLPVSLTKEITFSPTSQHSLQTLQSNRMLKSLTQPNSTSIQTAPKWTTYQSIAKSSGIALHPKSKPQLLQLIAAIPAVIHSPIQTDSAFANADSDMFRSSRI